MKRARGLAAFLVVAALALVPAASTGAPASRVFVPGQSLGGAKLGMTKAQVLRVWGKRHGVCRECPRTTWYFNERPFEPEGTGVVFRRGRAVRVFTVWRPRGWRTSDGLELGADADAVRDAYPAAGERRCDGYTALVAGGAGTRSIFYVYREKLWGFGLTLRAASPCV